jgi:CDP-diacylglycerol pyrophosphatase
MRLVLRLLCGPLAALACAFATSAKAADPDALWRIVHDLCTPNMKAAADPTPCLAVDLSGGYAVLKDLHGATQLLLIPIERVSGIESPALLAPGAPNYWQGAWRARPLFEARAGRPAPRDDIGMAINSAYGRSQNQLHIHLDCLRADVKAALRANQTRIGLRWSRLGVKLAGRYYRARRVYGADLEGRNPFLLLASGDPRARADMGAQTLAVAGAIFAGGRPGFVLLADRADPAAGDAGSAEDLLDHGCAVLGPPTHTDEDRSDASPG